jgi:hypothetical protein
LYYGCDVMVLTPKRSTFAGAYDIKTGAPLWTWQLRWGVGPPLQLTSVVSQPKLRHADKKRAGNLDSAMLRMPSFKRWERIAQKRRQDLQ